MPGWVTSGRIVLRLMECVRLRIKDIDFDRHQILVRNGKGEKDRRKEKTSRLSLCA